MVRRSDGAAGPPRWVEPQLCKLLEKAPTGDQWVHEVKFDGYRMAARIDRGEIQLLTRSGLDWTEKYPAIAAALAELKNQDRLSRRRALRRPARRRDLFRSDPAGRRRRRIPGLLRL
jgi:ATP dependent DNA ligase domain